MDESGELSLVLANRLPEIAERATRVERFLRSFGVPDETIFRVNLALDELLTNTITYGYRDAQQHVIRVTVAVAAWRIMVAIEDDAAPFDPFARGPADTSAGLDERRPGGLGIHLVREMIEQFDYQKLDGGNRVALRQSYAVAGNPAETTGAKMTEAPSPAVLIPSGRLDANSSAQFEKEVLEELTRSPHGMVMDFSRLAYVSSAGLRVVLLAAKKTKALGAAFVLCGLTPSVAEVFKISGFLSILTVEPDRDAALARFA